MEQLSRSSCVTLLLSVYPQERSFERMVEPDSQRGRVSLSHLRSTLSKVKWREIWDVSVLQAHAHW